MSLLQMSFSGAVMIAAVIVIRAFAINRLPKRTFLILWGIVLLRLLVPFSVPSALSVYSLMEQNITSDRLAQIPTAQDLSAARNKDVKADALDAVSMEQSGDTSGKTVAAAYSDTGESADRIQAADQTAGITFAGAGSKGNGTGNRANPEEGKRFKPLCFMIWFAGMILCMSYFAISYLHCRSEFQISLPVEDASIQNWIEECRRRCTASVLPVKNALVPKWIEAHPRSLVSVRQSECISTPLTYGIFRPVILLPRSTDWADTEQLQYILMHEYVHIRRHDALTKLIVTGALCIHWFNPMVWIMWFVFNRDVEISCDERVVRHMGEASKSAYALMLIQMEARRSGFAPLCSGLLSRFGNNTMEERITAIMKIRKKSMPAAVVAAVLVISVTTVFATSAAETRDKSTGKTTEKSTEKADRGTTLTKQEYEMLLALKFDGFEAMSISEYRDKVWALTDTEKYSDIGDIIERFFQDETIYAMYETTKGTDSNETADFLYNVLGPIMSGRQSVSFNGYAVTDFDSASENASLEYTATLTILDADQLTVGEYLSARHHIEEDMENSLKGLAVSELRDGELMKIYIDETVLNITMTYQNNLMRTDIEYVYRPLNGVSVDEMEDFQKERRDEWDKMMEPYVPFGLTYNYDWDTDDYKMYFNGKEVRGIYDEEENVWISEHAGIGENIYAADAVELFAVYENHKLIGLREATAQEMEEITARRQAATDAYQNEKQEIRSTAPATKEDYQSLFTLRTSD